MRHPDGSAAANVRAAAVRELADQYAEALRDYTREGAEDTLAWAFQLGQRAVDHGLGMREMAAMHEKGLLEALLEATVAADNATRIVELASDFQAVALAPFEKRHHRQVDEHATAQGVDTLGRQMRIGPEARPCSVRIDQVLELIEDQDQW